MKPTASLFASLLVAALVFGTAPVFAASPTPAPAAPAASGDQSEPADDDSAPPAEAPVPDPFLAEVLKTCQDGASGDKGTFQRLQDAGWNLAVDGDTQTPFYQAYNGEKEYDGVGTVDITYSLEVYPSMSEGYCSLSIDSAERKIGIADLSKNTTLKGEIRKTDDGIASNWEDNTADPTTFIQADQHAKDLYFLLDVTKLMKKPASDIPYVKPDTSGDTQDPGAGAGDGTDSGTNASN